MKPSGFARSIKTYLVRHPLLLAMALLTIATALLFYLEYRREELRLVESTRVAFSERLNSLELSVEQVMISLRLTTNWATNIWRTDAPEILYRQFAPQLIYTAEGDYFSLGPGSGIAGNVFGSGKPTDRTEDFAADLGLAIGLLPWFKAAKEESNAILQSYFVADTRITSAYPPIPPQILLPVGGGNLASAFDKFYEPHQGLQKNPDGKPYFLDPYVDRAGQGLVVTYAHPVYQSKRFVGVIGADIALGFLQVYTDKIGSLETRLIIAGERGQVLADSQGLDKGLATLEQSLPAPLRGMGQKFAQGVTSYRIDKYYVMAERLDNAPWIFIQIMASGALSKKLLLSQITFAIALLVLIAFLSVNHFAMRRRSLESALRESELRYSEVYNSTGEAIVVHALETGRILEVNRAFEEMFGFSREEAPGLQVADISIEGSQNVQKKVEDLIRSSKTEGPKTFEWHSRRKDGTSFWTEVSLRSTPIGGQDHCIAVIRDISDRKQAEAELREKQDTINAIVESSQDWIWTIDRNGVHTYSNPAVKSILGIAVADVIGRDLRELLHPDDRKIVEGNWPVWIEKKGGWNGLISRWRHRNGDYRHLESNSVPILGTDGGLFGFRGVDRDITDRVLSEQALVESEDKFRSLVETTSDWIWEVDAKGIYTYASPRVFDLLGYLPEEVIGRTPFDFILADEKERVVKLFAEVSETPRSFFNLENINRHKYGHPVILETSGVPKFDAQGNLLGFRGVDRDITQRKRAEEEKKNLEVLLAQAQKMEAIGTLAGGIAHDFNNILGAIMGYAQLIEMETPGNSKAHSHIQQLLAASDRAKNLVSQILAFSRQTKPEKLPIDIKIIVKEALKLVRASLPANIEIRQNYAPRMDAIMADQNQIHQIILNLCTNALHAMATRGGVLDVTVTPVEIKCEEIALNRSIPPGRYIRISVADTGHGIDAVTMERIFEPYFTTKEIGVGTGLGLAIVHGIVEDHGGAIKVKSDPGSGTCFHIFFPTIDRAITNNVGCLELLSSGTERILFVDDEKILLDLGKAMLTKLGYNVDCRMSPYEAFDAFKAHPEHYDLIISDMTMPKMNGDRLAKEILSVRPDMPIILCTGFSNIIDEDMAQKMGIKAYLMKPYSIRDLSKTIRNALDQDKAMSHREG